MEYIFAGFVAACAFLAIGNWRLGILLAIVIDAICDPIRKVTPDQPLWISHIVVGVWACVVLVALSQDTSIRKQLRRFFPGVSRAGLFIVFALIPAAGISLVMYRNGWFLVLIGAVSYGAPLLGILVGVQYAKKPADLRRFMVTYAIANGIMLTGNVAEQAQLGWPGLGGMADMEWIRHMPGVLVRLVSGFYRSPDMSGFHAAHVAMFSLVLAAPRRPGDTPKIQWLALTLFSLFCLFLTGRRKMFSLPVLFVLSWLVVVQFRKGRQKGTAASYLILGAVMLVAVTIGTIFFVSNEVDFEDHGIYLATTLVDTGPKLYRAIDSSVTTVAQSGILGSGLGVATQGNTYAGIHSSKVWQEDGTSRLFKELGVPGVLLMFCAAGMILNESRRSLRMIIRNTNRDLLRSVGLAVFAANGACYIISHQHISGSVPNAIMPIIFFGAALGQVIFDHQQMARHPPRARPSVETAVNPALLSIASGVDSSNNV